MRLVPLQLRDSGRRRWPGSPQKAEGDNGGEDTDLQPVSEECRAKVATENLGNVSFKLKGDNGLHLAHRFMASSKDSCGDGKVRCGGKAGPLDHIEKDYKQTKSDTHLERHRENYDAEKKKPCRPSQSPGQRTDGSRVPPGGKRNHEHPHQGNQGGTPGLLVKGFHVERVRTG